MRSLFIYETEAFTRGGDPYKKLGVGSRSVVFDETSDSYYRQHYSDEEWYKIIDFLTGEGWTTEETIFIMLSKCIRWSTDHWSGSEDDLIYSIHSFKNYYYYSDNKKCIRAMIDREMEEPMNEVFDVLTWSKKHLTPEILKNVEDSHDGKYGEKVQKGLFKCQGKDELLKWHNRTFEIGLMEREDFTRGGDPYKKMKLGSYRDYFDRDGKPLDIGSHVNVYDEPSHVYDFSGTVEGFWEDNALVVNPDGDQCAIKSEDIELNEDENFTRGGDPYEKLRIGSYRKIDKHGEPLKIGSSVNVDHKPHNYFEFTGTVHDFKDDYIIVADQDDYYYYIDPKDIELNEDENFTRGGDPYKKLRVGSHRHDDDEAYDRYKSRMKEYLSGDGIIVETDEISLTDAIRYLEENEDLDLDELDDASKEELYVFIDEMIQDHEAEWEKTNKRAGTW